MPPLLTLTSTRTGEGDVVLGAVGEIDLSNVDEFRKAFYDAVAEAEAAGARLVVDFGAVEYVDSAGINVLSAGAEVIHRLIVHPLLKTTFTVSGVTELVAVELASADQAT
ncbi:anti-anti-sigma factor [Mycolicibacterium iranicum]|uniref:Anti-anti-sigma factor n=1 Tax=Mycolicibacterium iranicum TaxID=912594 RepID=A0A839Q5B6_MYCIR|nr:STAS domain-containing protein [Mycolicibacterium iranicum]MBB2991438.1 anti-anti-sigma factor [Mycolicibacterium iranicum]